VTSATENFWTLCCKGRLTEADTQTIRLGATPSGLTSSHLHHPPIFYRPDALPAAQPTVSKHGRQLCITKLLIANNSNAPNTSSWKLYTVHLSANHNSKLHLSQKPITIIFFKNYNNINKITSFLKANERLEHCPHWFLDSVFVLSPWTKKDHNSRTKIRSFQLTSTSNITQATP